MMHRFIKQALGDFPAGVLDLEASERFFKRYLHSSTPINIADGNDVLDVDNDDQAAGGGGESEAGGGSGAADPADPAEGNLDDDMSSSIFGETSMSD